MSQPRSRSRVVYRRRNGRPGLRGGRSRTVALFGTTLAAGAVLMFLLEPMAAKMVLPFLGGAPAVWNTCVVFFQAMLLAG